MNKAPTTLQEAVIHFASYENCHEFMMKLRWPDGRGRGHGSGLSVFSYSRNAHVFKCYVKHEKQKFSLKVGTIFEDSPLGLDKWLPVMWLLTGCKNGISSYELARALGVTQKSAWFMLHRLRLALQHSGGGGKMNGTI